MKERLVLERQPPGDNWKYVDTDNKFTNLTSALAFIARQTGIKEFHVSATQGKVWILTNEPDRPPEIDDFYGD